MRNVVILNEVKDLYIFYLKMDLIIPAGSR